MEDNMISLTFEQALFFVIKINEWSEENNFNDQILSKYQKDFIERSVELAKMNIIKRFIKGEKYIISKSMYNYLSSVLNVDPLDEEKMKDYLIVVKNSLEEAKQKIKK